MPPKKKEETALIVAPAVETEAINKQTIDVVSQAKAITVTDNVSYAKASELISIGNAILKEIDDTFNPLVKDAHTLHKNLLAKKKALADPIEGALNAKKREMGNYQLEQDKIRRAEEARLAEIARQEAQDRALAEAALLEAQGESEAAEQVVQEAIEAPPPPVVLPKFQASEFGRSSRDVWKWRIVDLGKIPMQYLTVVENPSNKLMQNVSTSAIGGLVRAAKTKEVAEAFFNGGVEVWPEKSVY